jgi:dTDP-4-amino-4,6-dideoxygalactose transaminase
MKVQIPLVDLWAQYLSMKDELDAAVGRVVAESAFVGNSGNRFVRAFEEEFASFIGRDSCVACGNGTDALEILLQAAGVGPGDEVLVPAVSWIATSEAVSTRGATPVFVDVLPGRYTMDPEAAAAKVTSRTKAIIPVHLYGLPASMDEICHLAQRHGLFVLEDCAQAHAATYRARVVGTFGHAASFSFFPGKNLGAWGDAGAMLTDDPQLARTVRMIAQHGQGERKHDHQREGRNSRMDGLQAAILSAKLPHLRAWTAARQRLAARYRQALRDVVEGMQICPDDAVNVYHLFVIEVSDRDDIASALAGSGISTTVQYPRPLPLLPAYARFGHKAEDFPVASRLTSKILSLPLFPEMTELQQNMVMEALTEAIRHAGVSSSRMTTHA